MSLPIIPLSIILFLFGLCVGSFLNVVIDWSVGKRKSFFTPPSHCDYCRHKLGFWDLIPVFSFVFLRRRCRYCGKEISWHYPLVEVATGSLFVLSSYTLYPIPYTLFLFSVFLVIFVTDLKYGLIPDRVILPATFFILPYSLITHHSSLITALMTSAAFTILYWLTQGKALGLGDVKLSFFLGLTQGLPYVILAIWIGFVLGGLVATALLILKKKKLKDEIPLGPFLVTGSILTIFFESSILGLVDRLIGLNPKF